MKMAGDRPEFESSFFAASVMIRGAEKTSVRARLEREPGVSAASDRLRSRAASVQNISGFSR
jgi:hypothetical protein